MDSDLFDRVRRRLDAMESYTINNRQLFISNSAIFTAYNSCSYTGYRSHDEETTGEVGLEAEDCDNSFQTRITENSGHQGYDRNYSDTQAITNSYSDGRLIAPVDDIEEGNSYHSIRRDVSLLSSSSSVCTVESRIEAGRQAFKAKSIFEKYRRGNIVAASKFSMMKSGQESDEIISIPSSICESSIDDDSVKSVKNSDRQNFGFSSNESNFNHSHAHLSECPTKNPKKSYPFISPSSEMTPKKNNVNLRTVREMHGNKLNSRIDEISNCGNDYDERSFVSGNSRGSDGWKQDQRNAGGVCLCNSTLAKAKQIRKSGPKSHNDWNLLKDYHGGVEPEIYISTSSLTASTTDLTDVTSPSADCCLSFRSSFDDSSLGGLGGQAKVLRSTSSKTTSLHLEDGFVRSDDGRMRAMSINKQRNKINNTGLSMGANGFRNKTDQPRTRKNDVFEEEIETPKLITTVKRVHDRSFDNKDDSSAEVDDEEYGPITTPRLLQKIDSLFACIQGSETPDIAVLEPVDEDVKVSNWDTYEDKADDKLAPVAQCNQTTDRIDEGKNEKKAAWNKRDGRIHPRAVLERNCHTIIEHDVDNESRSEETIERLTSNAYFSSLLRENGFEKSTESRHEDGSVLFTNPPRAPKHETSKFQGSMNVNYFASTRYQHNDAQNSYSARDRDSHQPFASREPNHKKIPLDSTDEFVQVFKATQHHFSIPTIDATSAAKTDDYCIEIVASPSGDDSVSTISRNTFCSTTISSKEAQSQVDTVVRRLVAEEIERLVQSGASEEEITKMVENRGRLEASVKRMMRESDEQPRQIEHLEEMVKEEFSPKSDLQSTCSYGSFELHEAGMSHCKNGRKMLSTLDHLENMRAQGADIGGCLETTLKSNDGESFAKAARAFESWYGQHMELIESILQSKSNNESAQKILLLKSSMESAKNGMSQLKDEFLRKRKDLSRDNQCDTVHDGDHRGRSMLLSSNCAKPIAAKKSHVF